MRRIALVLALLACTVAGAEASKLRKPKRGFQMKVRKFPIAPGEDLEMCDYRRLPNTKEMAVDGFEVRMPVGAHHFVIWAYSGDTQDDAQFPQGPVERVGCTGLMPDDVIPSVLIPIQSPNSRFQFPAGMAMKIPPRMQVWLNPHMKSARPKTFTPDIRFNFYEAKASAVQHYVQGMIIGNTTAIHVPAGGDQQITAEWTAPTDLVFVQMATHQHQLGTYANIELVSADGTSKTMLYENEDWEHPRNFWPDPSLHLAAGEKVRITCRWHNPGTKDVFFGPETTDEMCFILGYFYREGDDPTPVTGGGCVSSKRGLLCPVAPVVAE